MNFDQDLIVRRSGFRDVGKLQVGQAVVAVDNGFHLVALCSGELITVVGRPPVGNKHKQECEDEQDKNDAENPLQYSFHKRDEGLRYGRLSIMSEGSKGISLRLTKRDRFQSFKEKPKTHDQFEQSQR